MLHLFVLFPLLMVLTAILFQLHRNHPDEITFYYFRNFIAIWLVCTFAIGAAETFFGTPYAKSMALAFAVPLLYVASAFLVKLPFALHHKKGIYLNVLLAVIIIAGVIFGATTFVTANKLLASTGPLQAFFGHMSKNLTIYRIWSTIIIFVPVGLYFISEGLKSQEFRNRIQALLIGSGLITAGVSEWFHIQAKHAAGADFYTLLGFFLITVGFFFPLFIKESPSQTT